MNTDLLFESIEPIVSINSDEKDFFLSILNSITVLKKEYIFKEREVSDKIYFIDSGILRLFYYENEEERTFDFVDQGRWFINFESYLTNSESIYNFQAIEDCKIRFMYKDDLERLYSKFPRLERIGRVIVEQVLVSITIELRKNNWTLDERYEDLICNKPLWIQQIPQKYIASYLNIQPESLSRMKSRLYSTVK